MLSAPERGQSSRAFQRREMGRTYRTVTGIGEEIWSCILGRKRCQLKLGKLGELARGMDYASVAAAVARFHKRLRRDKVRARVVVKLQAALMEV